MADPQPETVKPFTTRFLPTEMARLHAFMMKRQNATSKRYSFSKALRELVNQIPDKDIDLPSYRAWLKAAAAAAKDDKK